MPIYVPKSFNFGDDTYNMRVELAVLDWVIQQNPDPYEDKRTCV